MSKRKKRFLGYGFADEVAKVAFKRGHFKTSDSSDWKELLLPNFDPSFLNRETKDTWRATILVILCLILFFIIFLRLFHLQIFHGSKNRELADGNRIQIKLIHAPRGVIFDRNGKILAANSPAFRLKEDLLTREQALELEVKNDPRSQDLEIDNVRTYPMGERLAHLIGYVGQINEQQLKSSEYENYHPGDRIGQLGVEAQYEKVLRGVDGGEIIEVDSQGRKLRTLRRIPPISGQSIYLTIDADLQSKIYELMKATLTKIGSCCGAAVAMDPRNGQILSLLSFPIFDPNLFTQSYDDNAISEIFSRADSPILNRVLAGAYPPGSTFKIVSALAALSSGKITPQTTFEDSGVIYLGSFSFSNWYFNQYGKTEGAVNLIKALKRSNDTYFYRVGQIVGEQTLGNWAKKFRVDRTLGIDLPGEATGLVPDNSWKQKNLNLPWFPGDTLHMAIGQGFVLTTPLQILGITSYVAEGVLYKPHLILKTESEVVLENLTNPKWREVVKTGLEEAAKEGGTAWPFFTFPIPTAGKTGTAEFGHPQGKTHAWYTSYAPTKNPEIAMTVLIEAGGEGSSVAAPIVKEAYRWYFSSDKNKLIQDIYPQATESARTLGE